MAAEFDLHKVHKAGARFSKEKKQNGLIINTFKENLTKKFWRFSKFRRNKNISLSDDTF